MKKIRLTLILAAALLGSAAAHAQDWTAGFGYAATSFRGADCSTFLSTHPMHGFYAGASHDLYFSALAGLTFEPGLYFYYQSAQNESARTEPDRQEPRFINMHYLSVPVRLKYTFDLQPGSVTASVLTGPVFNVGLFGNLYKTGNFPTNTDSGEPDRRLTQVNAQWDFGAAVTVAGAVQLRIGYAVGLSRLVPEQYVLCNSFTVGAGLLF